MVRSVDHGGTATTGVGSWWHEAHLNHTEIISPAGDGLSGTIEIITHVLIFVHNKQHHYNETHDCQHTYKASLVELPLESPWSMITSPRFGSAA